MERAVRGAKPRRIGEVLAGPVEVEFAPNEPRVSGTNALGPTELPRTRARDKRAQGRHGCEGAFSRSVRPHRSTKPMSIVMAPNTPSKEDK
jgi:hypothetical protein